MLARSIGALVLAAVLSHGSSAAEIRHQPVGQGVGFIAIGGNLDIGDELVFERAAAYYERGVVLLLSPGGSAVAGMRIGEMARARRFSTGVAPGTTCASACALAWLGGFNRYMSASSRIGFHAVFTDDGETKRVSSVGNAFVGAYAQRMGLSASAIDLIVREDPHTIEWLTPAKAQAAGISLRLLEVEAPSGEAIGAAPKYPHFVTGLDPLGDNWLALKAGPELRSKRLAKLPPDTPLRVSEHSGRWLSVEIPDGRSGWVAREYVGCCRR
ncbi:SH3 domain-containing protein [Bosea sp. 2YAB26]|uniref:SH3 domain-containing protein n=1 Tax=Bosea sp. 2YAB26 TaxID=3237478 RepID=UPI003F8EB8B3